MRANRATNMQRTQRDRWGLRGAVLGFAACGALVAACSEDPGGLGSGKGQGDSASDETRGTEDKPPEHTALDDRVVDYGEALRTASLKLVRALPTLAQIKKLAGAADPKAAYEREIDAMLADVRFQERMIKWWKDTMRQGGGAVDDKPSRDTAPTFAARIMVEGKPLRDLFTATSNNCPSYDTDAHAFVDGDCDSGAPAQAGVLTNPGVMHQFYGNMAFRRVRWVQEIFVCTKFPAEYAAKPIEKNGADYVSPWPFESVATAPIDFQDTKSVICANCHTTINHIAPLFANFDAVGHWMDSIQVKTPQTPESIPTELSHWLQPGETTSWRLGEEVASLTELGEAIAKDPDVAECAVARMWNFAMSKEDIVTDLATVPIEVLQPYIDDFQDSGTNLKALLRSMLVSEDFVSF